MAFTGSSFLYYGAASTPFPFLRKGIHSHFLGLQSKPACEARTFGRWLRTVPKNGNGKEMQTSLGLDRPLQ